MNHQTSDKNGRGKRYGRQSEKPVRKKVKEDPAGYRAGGRSAEWDPRKTREEDGGQERYRKISENHLEGRNAVLEAFRSGQTVDKLFLQAGLQDGMILTIAREARKAGTVISYVPKEKLNQMSQTGHHQGAIALTASWNYAEVEDILRKAEEAGEAPFLFLLDGIEDPHNLGAIIRSANLAGAHGVIISKRHSAGLTAVAVRASAGAVSHTPVARVNNLAAVMEELKQKGIWFVCADMGGTRMYDLQLTGPLGIVVGNEGQGVSRLIRERCDMTAAIPMYGDIDSLNASVAAGVLAWEAVRQRHGAGDVNGSPQASLDE